MYFIECKDCNGELKYIGETSRSLGERLDEHFANMDDSLYSLIIKPNSKMG